MPANLPHALLAMFLTFSAWCNWIFHRSNYPMIIWCGSHLLNTIHLTQVVYDIILQALTFVTMNLSDISKNIEALVDQYFCNSLGFLILCYDSNSRFWESVCDDQSLLGSNLIKSKQTKSKGWLATKEPWAGFCSIYGSLVINSGCLSQASVSV